MPLLNETACVIISPTVELNSEDDDDDEAASALVLKSSK